MSRLPKPNVLLWFGVAGGAFAWAMNHVAGIAFGWARCNPPPGRFGLSVHGWAVGVAAAAAAVAILAELVCLLIFRDTREAEDAPPAARVHFLSVVGLTINPLALAIIILDGVGSAILPLCHQS